MASDGSSFTNCAARLKLTISFVNIVQLIVENVCRMTKNAFMAGSRFPVLGFSQVLCSSPSHVPSKSGNCTSHPLYVNSRQRQSHFVNTILRRTKTVTTSGSFSNASQLPKESGVPVSVRMPPQIKRITIRENQI